MAHNNARSASAKRIASAVDVQGKGAFATVNEKVSGAEAVRSLVKARAVTALEQGAVLVFPNLVFTLAEAEKSFLDARVSDGKAKNISLDHTTGKMQASSLTGDRAIALAAMMERFGSQATRLVHELLPYRNVERARTSFRPVQVKDRHYSKISDDRLLHIDAFPSRPMGGRRILRFFANVAPGSARRWHVGQPFEDFARAFEAFSNKRTPVFQGN